MDKKVNVPAWNHFPFLGYLHYSNKITTRFTRPPQFLPPLNPYLGFINHALPRPLVVVETKTVATQTDSGMYNIKAMELGQQIIDNMNYDI